VKVEWQLADLYVAATPDAREAIEKRVIQVNGKLADDPWDLGESRATVHWRAWFNPPLLIIFEIVPSDSLVVVQSVNRFGSRE
jgi:hypothetical protein